jgi:hypothetical protein
MTTPDSTTHVWVFTVERGGQDAINTVFATADGAANYVEEGYGVRPVLHEDDGYWAGETAGPGEPRRLTVRRWVVQS